MRYLTSVLVVLSTALWLGGLVALFVLALAVFRHSGLDRETAGRATSAMFVVFGRAQLAVGAVALIAAFLAYLPGKGRASVALFAILALGVVGAIVFNMVIVPKMEAMRMAGESQSQTFRTWHGYSMMLLTAMTATLLVAALVVPAICRGLLGHRSQAST